MGGRAGRCTNCVSDCSDQSSRSYPREKRAEAAAYGYGWPGKPILTREQWDEFMGHEAGEGAGGDGARLEVGWSGGEMKKGKGGEKRESVE